jgi:hypothetical protein
MHHRHWLTTMMVLSLGVPLAPRTEALIQMPETEEALEPGTPSPSLRK